MRWDDLRLFLAVHEQGSFSGAARVLKLGQPTLSRRIAELEASTGGALFERNSQGAVLTIAGKKLLPAAMGMDEWANEAEHSVGRENYLPEGRVRVAAPPGVAIEFVVPLAAKLRIRYPLIKLEVLSGIQTLNLSRGEADLSLRTAKPVDADLVCLDEVFSPMRAYASTAYAQQLPEKPSVSDVGWIGWPEQEGAGEVVFSSDDFTVQIAGCKAGLGALVLPQGMHAHTSLNQLQELDIDLGPDAVGHLYLVCHKRHRHLPRVERVIEAIMQEFDSWRNAR